MPLDETTSTERSRARPGRFPVVGVAASTGGVRAFGDLIAALPAGTGLAFVLIQHGESGSAAALCEALAHRTPLPVVPAANGTPLVADCVFVAAPGASLAVMSDGAHLASGPAVDCPADAFMRSLARTHGPCAVGVVLSGTARDGTLGLRAIKQGGGLALAQAPDTAAALAMPSHAIASGHVDAALPPADIARHLARLAPELARCALALPGDGAASLGDAAAGAIPLGPIVQRLRDSFGIDFAQYKPPMLLRRTARRMAIHNLDADGYLALLDRDAGERDRLYRDWLIGITAFFRDAPAYAELASRVFPQMLADKALDDPIRVWVPGCATGEEAYSIGVELLEYMEQHAVSAPMQIFGTDANADAIDRAREGRFARSIEHDVSPERLQRFFTPADGAYRVGKRLRDVCIFARHDVTRDPPFSKMNLISCRNLLIYLDAATQQRVMRVFRYALRARGVLLVGPTESVGADAERALFVEASEAGASRWFLPRALPEGMPLHFADPLPGRPAAAARAPGLPVAVPDSAPRVADRMLLARFSPPALLVDAALQVLQFYGDTAAHVQQAAGAPSANLRRLLRPSLFSEVAPAVDRALAGGGEQRVSAPSPDDSGEIGITVLPLALHDGPSHCLVLFDRAAAPSPLPVGRTERNRRLAFAEREAAALRASLQDTLERHELIKEELRTAHEAALSANEELQSGNEELEASKEELQSTNEEVRTINDELRERNAELARANAELERARTEAALADRFAHAVVDTVTVPLLVLDGDLAVVRANAAFYAMFALLPGDVEGHPLCDLAPGCWNVQELQERLAAVLGVPGADGASTGQPLVAWDFDCTLHGDRRLLSLTARAIRLEVDFGRVLVGIDDVTERESRADALRDDGRRKDEFLAMLAHELRNPLSSVVHASYLLRQPLPPERIAALDRTIERQAHRLVRMVDELLDVARIGRGLIELHRRAVDLRRVVEQAVETTSSRLAGAGHRLSLTLPEHAVEVDGDADRLEQVVVNLLDNAIKYTPDNGGIALELSAAGNECRLSVKDSGIGLGAAELERIFDLFAQVDRRGPAGGLGIGLALVRRLAVLHGGRVEARSGGHGKGSEFLLYLPCRPAQPAVEAAADAPGTPVAPPPVRRVLVVDDDVDGAETTAMLIATWGHDTRVAHDAAQALQAFAAFEPEVAIVDINLKGDSGHSLAQRLRAAADGRRLMLIALTGFGRHEDRLAALGAGFDEFLVKPPPLDDLRRLIERLPVLPATAVQPASRRGT